MILNDLKNYWVLVSAHRRGNLDALLALKLMGFGNDKSAGLAAKYLNLNELSETA